MISRADCKYFDRARQAANESDFPRTHVGCVAVYHGDIIATGCNGEKTHPMQKYYNKLRNGYLLCHELKPKIHAEMSILNQIKSRNIQFSKVKLYIYRIRLDQPYGIARPCPSCMAAIKDLGIRHIYYTTNDGLAYEKL